MSLAFPSDSLPGLCAKSCIAIAVFLMSPAMARTADEQLPAFESLSIEPSPILLSGSNRQQQIIVTAKTRSGSQVDVTHRCNLSSSDLDVASLSGTVVRSGNDGTAEVRVRLGTLSASVVVRVRDSGTDPRIHFVNDVMPLFSKLGCNSAGCHGKEPRQNNLPNYYLTRGWIS